MTARTIPSRALIVALRSPVRQPPTLGEWWRVLLTVLGEVPREVRDRLT